MDKVKLVMLGNQGCGKTSLVMRCLYDNFEPQYGGTIGIDFMSHNIVLDGKTTRLQIWDTAGQERFRSLVPSYIRDSRISLLLYDVTNEDSFNKVQWWIDTIKRERTKDDSIIIIVGNKIDLTDNRMISTSDACALARKNNCLYRETSAKTGHNAKDVFKYAVEQYRNKVSASSIIVESELQTVNLDDKYKANNETKNQCLC